MITFDIGTFNQSLIIVFATVLSKVNKASTILHIRP